MSHHDEARADQLDVPTVLARVVDHLAGTYGSGRVEVIGMAPGCVGLSLAGEPAELRCTGGDENRCLVVQVGPHPAVEIPLAGSLDELLGEIRECVLLPPTTAALSPELFVMTDEDSDVYRLPANGASDETTNAEE